MSSGSLIQPSSDPHLTSPGQGRVSPRWPSLFSCTPTIHPFEFTARIHHGLERSIKQRENNTAIILTPTFGTHCSKTQGKAPINLGSSRTVCGERTTHNRLAALAAVVHGSSTPIHSYSLLFTTGWPPSPRGLGFSSSGAGGVPSPSQTLSASRSLSLPSVFLFTPIFTPILTLIQHSSNYSIQHNNNDWGL